MTESYTHTTTPQACTPCPLPVTEYLVSLSLAKGRHPIQQSFKTLEEALQVCPTTSPAQRDADGFHWDLPDGGYVIVYIHTERPIQPHLLGTMKVYTLCNIVPASGGFGLWERGEVQVSPGNSYADECQLEIDGNLVWIGHAIEDEEFIAAGVVDISGLVINEPEIVYACLTTNAGKPTVSYYGMVETIVPSNFFDSTHSVANA